MKSYAISSLVSAFLCLISFRVSAEEEFASIQVKVDPRGLIEMDSGTNNLVIKPYGGYAAQDYSLTHIQKSGNTLSADFGTRPAIKMLQTTESVTTREGETSMKVTYNLTPTDGKKASYEAVYLFFPFAAKDYAGARVDLDSGAEMKLPLEPAGDIVLPADTQFLRISNAKKRFTVKTQGLRMSLKDLRPKTEAFQIRLELPQTQNVSAMKLAFEVATEIIPYTVRADGREWLNLPVATPVEVGSLLDFSFRVDAPAGKHGRIVPSAEGHLAYENLPGSRVKLLGTNLCFSANYLPKQDADNLARSLQLMGYNSIRFHHTDVDLIQGAWNAQSSHDIDPEQLDRIDYMFAAMNKAGMYVSIDLYTLRRFGEDEIEGWNKYVSNPNIIKGLVPILPGAFEAWSKMALKWLSHVNPYTGLAMKDDPALLSICPVNEDSIFSVWNATPEVAKLYSDRFELWLADKKLSGENRDVLFAQFLIEIKMESNRQLAQFFKDNGVKAMITGSNWWNTQGQTFTRDLLDVVDNHQYWDHPMPHYLPSKYNQRSNMRESMSYIVPAFMMPTRIFGKPYTVTEWNFCAPNQYRAEAGAMFGAYSALQDWDGLYRFAWAHAATQATRPLPIQGFDISTDPLSLLTERQVVLLFGRGDVSPAIRKYVYAVNMQEATREGVGNMWKKGLFPREFTVTGLISQVGSQVADSGRRIQGRFDGVVAAAPVAEDVLAGNVFLAASDLPKVPESGDVIVSDTGEVMLNNKQGYVKVVTPKTECFVSPAGIDHVGNSLAIQNNNTFASISASSMDGETLAGSRRVLLFHLTNVLNSHMRFVDASMTTLLHRGDFPYVVRAGSVGVVLKNRHPGLTLHALDFSGKRVRVIPAVYAESAYHFTMEISADNGDPVLIYELAER